jgi:amino acid transporter
MASSSQPNSPPNNRVRIVVATSVMLTFISYWRAAAVILNDLGSSAFYAAGIAEQAVGKSAPWLVVAVMLFAFAVCALYVESCSMFVRGGVYRIVKEAVGGKLAKAAVSALMFDYVLTGPISGVSAGQYLAGLVNELLAYTDSVGLLPGAVQRLFHGAPHLNESWVAVALASGVTIYYWWQNIKGIEESSEKALRVMQITTVMVVLLLGWSVLTLLLRPGWQLPPWPIPRNLSFTPESLGFLKGHDFWKLFPLFGVMMAFGHSVLAMSGEESLAQVYREIAHPKLQNLKRTALIIGIYSFIFTGLVSLLAVMLIPDAVRVPVYKDNLIAGLAMYLVGPQILRILFRVFVVFVGFLILSGAINTAIVGSNGVLNRVSEDGVLTDWFRRPHRRFGTTHRIINLVVIMQLAIIFISHGDVYVLGEAYAFGVMWSFALNSISMLVLRFRYKGERGWKVPPNPRIAGHEIPIGLASICFVLCSTAIVNLFTKSVATVSGIIFSGVFFAVFTISESVNRRKHAAIAKEMQEHFQLLHRDTVHVNTLGVRRHNVLVAVRDYNAMFHLRWVLEHTNTDEQDVVVMSARVTRLAAGAFDLHSEQIFSDYEQRLFTRAVSIAEKAGKRISLLVVPARDPWSAIVQTANQLQSSAVVIGLSSRMPSQQQSFSIGRAWEAAPEPKRQFVLQIVRPDLKVDTFRIGPHAPTMKSEDVHLVHRLWLNITKELGMDKVHHSDIVTVALTRFARDYGGHDRSEILRELKRMDGKAPLPSNNEGPDLAAEPPSPDGDEDRHKRPPTSDRPF